MTSKKWFEDWFDSEYYHLLYNNRDQEEACKFVEALVDYLKPGQNDKIIDVACGKGRHSIQLNKMGYDVTGVDLSVHSIVEASKHANDKLKFFVHDMRQPLPHEYDLIFNLFTSFGYFDTDDEEYQAFESMANALHDKGKLVIDFMNAEKANNELVPHETKTVDSVEFKISRKVEDGRFIKTIEFNDSGEHYFFQEKVRALKLKDFKGYAKEAGLKLDQVFGDYELGEFDQKDSPRLIMIFKCS